VYARLLRKQSRWSNSIEPAAHIVLVVEDRPDLKLLLQLAAGRVCPDIGFRFVQSGFETLDYLAGERAFADRQKHPFPNLVLLDFQGPGMEDPQILHRIRQLAQSAGLTLLAWSGGADAQIAWRAQQAGVDWFIPKPFSYDVLMEEVRRICDQARGTATDIPTTR
jgi:DNA-binding response OmpR family regulator